MKRILSVLLLLINFVFGQAQFTPVYQQAEIREAEMRRYDRMRAMESNANLTEATENFNVNHIRFEWNVNPAVKYISGKVTFAFTMTQTSNSVTLDLHQQLIADSVWYHGNKVSISRTAQHGLVITFPSNITANSRDSFSVFYQGVPDGSGFGSFVTSSQSGVPVMWTLSEPYGSRDWWPCKNGLTDKADSIDIYLSYPSSFVGSTNGKLVGETINAGTRTSHFSHRYPIASYLVAIAITNYQLSTDTVMINGKQMPYIGYYYPSSYDDFKNYEVHSKDFLVLFSQLFGDYPFVNEKYSQTQFHWGGGMEHQTNSFMTTRSPNLQAHELGHQWFGDRITCGSWSDIWLNEGYATYLTLLTMEYIYTDFFMPNLIAINNFVTAQPDGSVYVVDTTNIGRIFSNRLTYNKGAYVVHMLRWKVGDSAFYRGMRRYLKDPAVSYGFARTADLQRNIEQESGMNLTTFFQKWIYGEGHPNYTANWSQNANHWAKVKLNQTPSHASVSFFDMPVELSFRSGTQETRITVDHTFSGQEFWVNVGFVADTVVIDPDYWLLARTRTTAKIPGNTTANDLKIYPNPAPYQFHVSLKNPSDKKLSIQLYNSIGQLVFKKEMETPGRDELIDIPSNRFAKGTYILKIRSEKSINVTRKIIF